MSPKEIPPQKREKQSSRVCVFALAFFPEEISYIESLYSAMGEGKRNGGENTVWLFGIFFPPPGSPREAAKKSPPCRKILHQIKE